MSTTIRHRPNPGTAALIPLLVCLLAVAPGEAEVRQLAEAGKSVESSIATGERRVLLVDGSGGQVNVGGHTIDLDPGFAVAGATADHHYLAVIAGEARLGDIRVERGEVLLLQPWGAAPRTAIFEAASLAGFARGMDAGLDGALSRLERGQKLKLFFGRYTRTAFDLQNPGGEEFEASRGRSVGSDVISSIRYSGARDQIDIERRVVGHFVDAMNRGDVEAAATLFDPTRFGGESLDRLGNRARVATVSLLSRDWDAVDGDAMERTEDRTWQGGELQLKLAIIGDFIYVSTVSRGG